MRTIGKRRGAVTIAIALAVGAVTHPADAENAGLLPDLRQAPVGCPGGYGGDPAACGDWDVCAVQNPSAPSGSCVAANLANAVRLRFTTAEDNVGDGPLLLYGRRESARQPTMEVRQAFQSRADGVIPGSFQAAQLSTATSAYYEPAKAHQHWHLMGFEHFELRTPEGDAVVADRKNGFCLGDRYILADAGRLQRTVPDDDSPLGNLGRFLHQNMCNHHEPTALTVTEGISVGRGDDYRYDVDFQWLDITEVPSGTYDVVNTVNSDRTLRESNYDNNSSSIAISVQWPSAGRSAPKTITALPKVTLLRSCPGHARCAGTSPK
jgi:hypothetical protein